MKYRFGHRVRYEVEWHYQATVWGHYPSFKTYRGAFRFMLANIKDNLKSCYGEPLAGVWINEVKW